MARLRPGQEASLAPPCSNLRSFGSKFTVLKNVQVAILGLFGATRSHLAPPAMIRRPRSDSAPGELCPLAPLVTPLVGSFHTRNVMCSQTLQDVLANVGILHLNCMSVSLIVSYENSLGF